MRNETIGHTPNHICLIIPAYNEDANLGRVLRESLSYCPHIFVIDDGSTDRTQELAAASGTVLLRHEVNRGKGQALKTGFKKAIAEGFKAVITMDGDGQHDPAEIPKFLETYRRTGIPVLVGNRMKNLAGMPLIRQLTNRMMSWIINRQINQYIPDTQCGYRLYRCDVVAYISAQSEYFATESEILLHIARRGIRIGSVRIATIYTDQRSKIQPLRDTIRFFKMISAFRRLHS